MLLRKHILPRSLIDLAKSQEDGINKFSMAGFVTRKPRPAIAGEKSPNPPLLKGG